MPRISLDITREQHQQLKTISSFAGFSMKDFILSRVFADARRSVFEPRNAANASEEELENLQQAFFNKSQIVVLSESKWAEFKEALAENKIAAHRTQKQKLKQKTSA